MRFSSSSWLHAPLLRFLPEGVLPLMKSPPQPASSPVSPSLPLVSPVGQPLPASPGAEREASSSRHPLHRQRPEQKHKHIVIYQTKDKNTCLQLLTILTETSRVCRAEIIEVNFVALKFCLII